MRRPITAIERTRLAVLGSPIAHSRSPLLHAAAYEALGLDWQYEAREVTGDNLRAFIEGLDDSWRGLSLTMPLKRDVVGLLTETDELVSRIGVANTVLLDGGVRGFNTDVFGITEAFRAHDVESLGLVHVLGGGATALSALVAVAELGATRVQFTLRDATRGRELQQLGASLGVDTLVQSFDSQNRVSEVADAVVSTMPGHSDHALQFAEKVRRSAILFDVAYDPWPSTLATSWLSAGGRVISGLEMLTLQALAQVRIFVGGSPLTPLPNEAIVLSAMRRAVGL